MKYRNIKENYLKKKWRNKMDEGMELITLEGLGQNETETKKGIPVTAIVVAGGIALLLVVALWSVEGKPKKRSKKRKLSII